MKEIDSAPIFIIHFQPLELYPPITNLLNFLAERVKEKIIIVSNRKKNSLQLKEFTIDNPNLLLIRTGIKGNGLMARLYNYGLFYFRAFFLLLKYRPASVLYYETLSSAPALFYKKIFGKKVQLLVHYHEYTTPKEYAQNMLLSKWFHKIETSMYRTSFAWVSHTNEVRMKKFRADNNLCDISNTEFSLLPNYPPGSWIADKPVKEFSETKKLHKLVYVGALGCETMYLKELINWVGKHPDNLSLDFYSQNMEPEANQLILNCRFDNIIFKGAVEYNDLPRIFKNYDVGLVIYKPYSDNMIYNSSNKVFEYLAGGLDVWFSKDMIYTFSFIRDRVYPKILPVDFGDLDNFNYTSALCRDGLLYESSEFYYEKVYGDIYNKMSFAS